MCNHIGKETILQILIHPIWWTQKQKTIDTILNEIVADYNIQISKAKKIHLKYLKDLKSIKN